jgi:hypothetical protein
MGRRGKIGGGKRSHGVGMVGTGGGGRRYYLRSYRGGRRRDFFPNSKRIGLNKRGVVPLENKTKRGVVKRCDVWCIVSKDVSRC